MEGIESQMYASVHDTQLRPLIVPVHSGHGLTQTSRPQMQCS